MGKPKEKQEGLVKRIRPHAEWEAIFWGMRIMTSLLTSSAYGFFQHLRKQPVDWIGLAILFVLTLLASAVLLRQRRNERRSNPTLPVATKDTFVWNQETREEVGKIVNAVKYAGGQAGICWIHSAGARDLEQMIEQAWHHWNDAGERLVHPLDARIDKLKDYLADYSDKLLTERRDFMVLYANHLSRVKVDLPGFSSRLMEMGYPSNKEYFEVFTCIREHAKKLEDTGNKIWENESPDESLYEKPIDTA